MGGEPLLHPNVCEFIQAARKYFPKSRIALVTNGILLKTMPLDFWETLRENKIIIEMSHYPIVKNFDSLLDLIKSNGIEIGAVHSVGDFTLMLDKNGNSDIQETFKKCPNRCVNFRNGRLVVCPIACYMDIYNNYFKSNIPAENGIEVSVNSAKNILKYLKAPIKTCSYCVVGSEVKNIPWEVSQKQADEWFID